MFTLSESVVQPLETNQLASQKEVFSDVRRREPRFLVIYVFFSRYLLIEKAIGKIPNVSDLICSLAFTINLFSQSLSKFNLHCLCFGLIS